VKGLLENSSFPFIWADHTPFSPISLRFFVLFQRLAIGKLICQKMGGAVSLIGGDGERVQAGGMLVADNL